MDNRRSSLRLWLLAISLAGVGVAGVVSGCGGDDGVEGDPCEGGPDCSEELFCFIESPDAQGVCTAPMDPCGQPPDCGCLQDEMCNLSSSCTTANGGDVTLTCTE